MESIAVYLLRARAPELRPLQKNSHPREMTVTGQKQLCRPAVHWPVTVTLDIYFLEMALVKQKHYELCEPVK